jgi:hypothetical protein
MIADLFARVEEHFYACLTSSEHHDVARAMEKLKASLLAVEEYSEFAKDYEVLFLEMFQFEETSGSSLWEETPKLHSAIGEFIHLKNSYEDEFLEEVATLRLGQYFKMG